MKKISIVVYFSFLLVALIYNPFGGINTYELPKQSWLFLVFGLSLALASVYLLTHTSVTVVTNKRILLICALWSLSYVLSTVFSIAPIESFWGSYIRQQGLVIHVVYGIFFIISLLVLQKEKFQNIFFIITSLLGGVASVAAIIHWFSAQPWNGFATLLYGERSYAFQGAPNFLGQFLLFAICSNLFFLKKVWRKKYAWWYITLVNTFLTLLALCLTRNRASFIGLGIGLLLWGLYLLKKNSHKIVLIVSVLAVASLIVFTTHFDLRSAGTRKILFTSALPLISQHPILGSGPETYYQTAQQTLGEF